MPSIVVSGTVSTVDAHHSHDLTEEEADAQLATLPASAFRIHSGSGAGTMIANDNIDLWLDGASRPDNPDGWSVTTPPSGTDLTVNYPIDATPGTYFVGAYWSPWDRVNLNEGGGPESWVNRGGSFSGTFSIEEYVPPPPCEDVVCEITAEYTLHEDGTFDIACVSATDPVDVGDTKTWSLYEGTDDTGDEVATGSGDTFNETGLDQDLSYFLVCRGLRDAPCTYECSLAITTECALTCEITVDVTDPGEGSIIYDAECSVTFGGTSFGSPTPAEPVVHLWEIFTGLDDNTDPLDTSTDASPTFSNLLYNQNYYLKHTGTDDNGCVAECNITLLQGRPYFGGVEDPVYFFSDSCNSELEEDEEETTYVGYPF